MPDLKITIGGDARGLQEELKKSQAEISKTAIEANKLDSSLKKSTASAGQSIFNLTEKLRTLQSSVFTEKDRLKIASYNQEIKKTEIEIAKLNALGTAGTGGGAFSGIAAGAGNAYSAVRKLAYILPGVGVAGIIGFATEPIINFIGKLFEATDAEKKLAAQAEELKKFDEEIAKNYGKEISSLEILRGAIESTNLPMAKRLQAIKDLRKEFPGLFDGLTNEQLLTGKVANAYDLAAEAILRKSRASAAAGEIERIDTEKIKVQLALEKEREKLLKDLANAKAYSQTITGSGLGVGGTTINVSKANAQSDILNAFGDAASKARVELEDLDKEQQFFLKIAVEGADQIIKVEDNKAKSYVKSTRTISDVLRELRIQLEYLNEKELKLNTDEAKGKISALESAIKELITKFGKQGKENTIELFAEINAINLKEQLIENSRFQLKNPIKIEPVITIEPVVKNTGWMQDILDEIERVKKEAAKKLSSFQDLFAGIGVDIITAFAEGIGNAAAGKGFQQFFQGIFSAVGAGLKKLGVYFLVGSKLIEKIKKLLLSVPAVSAIAAIGLIALGTAIQAGASKNAFATGVRNFGGGTALVGERGPELVQLPTGSNVVPNGQLNAMSSGGNMVVAEYTIRGQDLAVVLKRANQTISRNG